jgi:aryl-alcohol dehydrogenase-like predicted oxidoreductase
MKVCCQGRLLSRLTMAEAVGYVLSLPGVTNVIIGCQTSEEVDQNAEIVRQFVPFDADTLKALEDRTCGSAKALAYYK